MGTLGAGDFDLSHCLLAVATSQLTLIQKTSSLEALDRVDPLDVFFFCMSAVAGSVAGSIPIRYL
jgi:hypothetical protein